MLFSERYISFCGIRPVEQSDSLRKLGRSEAVSHCETDGTASQTATSDLSENGEELGCRESLRDEAEGGHNAGAYAHHGDRVADARSLHRTHGCDTADAHNTRGNVGNLMHVVKAQALQPKVASNEGSSWNKVEMGVGRGVRRTL